MTQRSITAFRRAGLILMALPLAGCLATAQVFCQRCQDSCEQQAIRFSPRLGRVPTPSIHAESCNGCGACVADCPVGSISIGLSRGEASR